MVLYLDKKIVIKRIANELACACCGYKCKEWDISICPKGIEFVEKVWKTVLDYWKVE